MRARVRSSSVWSWHRQVPLSDRFGKCFIAYQFRQIRPEVRVLRAAHILVKFQAATTVINPAY